MNIVQGRHGFDLQNNLVVTAEVRLEMLLHPAWQLAPVPLRRMLERLEVEHLRHGGFRNGELFVSWNQFVAASISRRKITPTQELGQALGLMFVKRPDEPGGDLRAPNAYGLTYLPLKGKDAPSDDWKLLTRDRVETLVNAYLEIERGRRRPTLRVAA